MRIWMHLSMSLYLHFTAHCESLWFDAFPPGALWSRELVQWLMKWSCPWLNNNLKWNERHQPPADFGIKFGNLHAVPLYKYLPKTVLHVVPNTKQVLCWGQGRRVKPRKLSYNPCSARSFQCEAGSSISPICPLSSSSLRQDRRICLLSIQTLYCRNP